MRSALPMILVLLAVVMTVCPVLSCRKGPPAQDQQAGSVPTAEAQQIRQEIRSLVDRHRPDYDWKATSGGSLFTAQVQGLFTTRIGHPLLTIMMVTDVERQENQYLLIGHDRLSINLLFLRLKCSQSQAEYVMNIPEGRWAWFAIVFRLDSFYRPTWELAAYPDGDAAYIDVGETGTWFIKGECIDILYVGQDEIALEDVMNTRETNRHDGLPPSWGSVNMRKETE